MDAKKLKSFGEYEASCSFVTERLRKNLISNYEPSFAEIHFLRENGSRDSSQSDIEISRRKSSATAHVANAQQLLDAINDHPTSDFLISVRQKNSLSTIEMSPDFLITLVSRFQISSEIYDFLAFFGPLHGETNLSPPVAASSIASVHARERRSCLIYVLRIPEQHLRSESNPFSIPQCLVYYQRSSLKDLSLLFITGTASAGHEHLVNGARPQSNAGFVHMRAYISLIKSAASAWRPLLACLSQRIDQQAASAVAIDLSDLNADVVIVDTRKLLKKLEDTIAEAQLNLQHTEHNSRVFRRHLESLRQIQDPDEVASITQNEFGDCCYILNRVDDILHHSLEQARVLMVRLKSTSKLVSNILDLSNSNTLRQLAEKAAVENAVMQKLTKKTAEDAAAVKVLTVLTLIYLPSSVVLNFFSTSFVNTTMEPSGSEILTVASNWWIAIAATVPLTIFTLCMWWVFVQHEVRQQWPASWLKYLHYLQKPARQINSRQRHHMADSSNLA